MNQPNDAPRLRLRTTIDFTKADANCTHCNGTGVAGHRAIEDHEGNAVRAPIVCRCVSRNGGVTPDKLDALLADMSKRLSDGSFGETLAADILKVPEDQRDGAIRNVRAQIENPETTELVREALQRCLAIVSEQGGACVSAENA